MRSALADIVWLVEHQPLQPVLAASRAEWAAAVGGTKEEKEVLGTLLIDLSEPDSPIAAQLPKVMLDRARGLLAPKPLPKNAASQRGSGRGTRHAGIN